MYAYARALIDDVNERVEEHSKFHGSNHRKDGECEKFHEEITEVGEEIELVTTLFWKSLRSELGLQKKNIGIRDEWKVVLLSEKNEDGPRIEVISVGLSGSLADLLRAVGK